MREIVHIQAGQCGNQIGAKVINSAILYFNKSSSGFYVHTLFDIPAFSFFFVRHFVK